MLKFMPGPGLHPTRRYRSYPEDILVLEQYAVLDEVDWQDALQIIEARNRPGMRGGRFHGKITVLLVKVRGRQQHISVGLQHLVAKFSSDTVNVR